MLPIKLIIMMMMMMMMMMMIPNNDKEVGISWYMVGIDRAVDNSLQKAS